MEIYEAGYRSVNPMYSCVPTRAPWIVHIAWDIYTLLRCDAVFFQKDWKQSRGARIEYRVAKLAGKEILLQTEWGKASQNSVVNNVSDNGNSAACAAAIAEDNTSKIFSKTTSEMIARWGREYTVYVSSFSPTFRNLQKDLVNKLKIAEANSEAKSQQKERAQQQPPTLDQLQKEWYNQTLKEYTDNLQKQFWQSLEKETMDLIGEKARLLQRPNALPTWANKKEMRRIHSIRTLTEFEKEVLGIEGESNNGALSKQPSSMEQRKQWHTERQPKRKGETFNG